MVRNTIINLLEGKKTYWSLLLLNFIVGLLIFILTGKTLGGDYETYNSLADGLLTGNYSMYHFLPQYFPDTFRNPGYPVFLAFFKLFSSSLLLIQVAQLLLYFATIFLILNIIDHYFEKRLVIKNIFLLLLSGSIYIAIYTPSIAPEILMCFMMTLSFWIDIKLSDKKYFKYLLLGLLYGFIFQVRPVFLFFPLLKFILDWIVLKKEFLLRKNSIILVIYVLTMIPYGLWNYNNHGVFSITSLRGGAEVLNAGYWAQKIPGYKEDRSFANTFFEEPILFINRADKEKNIELYNKEWDFIDSSCARFLTLNDSFQINLWHTGQYHFPATLSGRYTMERERLIKAATINDMMHDKMYVIKSKLYSAVRLWVTGVQIENFRKATLSGKFILLIPMLLTGTIFLLSVLFIPIAFIKYKFLFTKLYSILILIIYYGLIHVPFVIQSRYTIPVRMLLLLVLAVSIYHLFLKEKSGKSEIQKS